MKRAVYTGARGFDVLEAEPSAPGPEEVLVEVAYTGLCGTDLHIFHGDMDARVGIPAVIGHEMSGRVAEVGADVADWSTGAPVTVIPLAWCGQCAACRAGHTHICHALNFLGIDSAGSLQQYWTVPAHTLVALPQALSLQAAALVEPTAVAVHDVRRAGVRTGEQVVVVGAGPVGTLIAIVARNSGAEVVVVEPDPFRRDVARSLQFVTLDPASTDVPAWVDTWTSGAGAAVSFEVSGASAGVATAVDVLATRGRLCLVAIHPHPREINLHRFFWRELTLCGARLYRRHDYDRAVELVASGIIPADTMITSVVTLSEIADAFAALESGAGMLKVLVDCQVSG
jgi:2-desacetyl-2-hydroxyethyl bacteriochlorophyllide A dehydrogenase